MAVRRKQALAVVDVETALNGLFGSWSLPTGIGCRCLIFVVGVFWVLTPDVVLLGVGR